MLTTRIRPFLIMNTALKKCVFYFLFTELSVGMRKLHETFVALAGRLQSVHTQVESQKEQYLNLRKYILKDPTNIFLKPTKEIKTIEATLQSFNNNNISGPTPFSSLGAPGMGMMMPPQPAPSKPPPAYPANNTTLSKFSNCRFSNH